VIDDEALLDAEHTNAPVVLVFENGDPALPLILSVSVGNLETAARPPHIVAVSEPVTPEQPSTPREGFHEGETELRIDGRRLVLEGTELVELRCGDASIELRADGTVKVRGRDIASLARRRQRITGGTVKIN
jgi:hypothetical protein